VSLQSFVLHSREADTEDECRSQRWAQSGVTKPMADYCAEYCKGDSMDEIEPMAEGGPHKSPPEGGAMPDVGPVAVATMRWLAVRAARKATEATLGPKQERAVAKAWEATLAHVVREILPEDAEPDYRHHIEGVLARALNNTARTGAFSLHTEAERKIAAEGLVQQLQAPSSEIDPDTLGIDVGLVFTMLFAEWPSQLVELASRDQNLFPFVVVEQLEDVRALLMDMGQKITMVSERAMQPEGAGLSEAEEMRIRSLAGQGLIPSLQAMYPLHPPADLYGNLMPICIFPAQEDEWGNLNAALGELTDIEVPAYYTPYSDKFDPSGKEQYDADLKAGDRPGRYNDPTYRFLRLYADDNGRMRIDCGLSRYFASLATSEMLDAEFMQALAPNVDELIGLDSLKRREWLHRNVRDLVTVGDHRAAAVSIATVTLMETGDGRYQILLVPRSIDVATHPLFNHVAPAGIFAPLNWDNPTGDYSVCNCLYREFLEELYDVKELARGERLRYRVEREPEIQRLQELIQQKKARLLYTGISVNLLTMRPEICTLLLIQDPEWIDRESDPSLPRPMKLNWEYLPREAGHLLRPERKYAIFLDLDENLEPIEQAARLGPSELVPNAAAAIGLAVPVAKRILAVNR
jgi:hypothetical protein